MRLADRTRSLVANLAHVNRNLVKRTSLDVAVAVNHNAVVALIHEVRRAGDVVQAGRLASPLLHLTRVRDEEDVHVVMLRKALHLSQHAADVLRLCLVLRALVVEFVVRVDHQASNAVAQHRRLCETQYPFHARKLVVLAANEVEVIVQPDFSIVEVVWRHVRKRAAKPI